MRRLAIFIAIILLGSSATAGPWLREDGKTFSAVASKLDRSYRFTTDTFIEHGITPKLTIGVDVTTTRSAIAQTGSATAFMRRAFGPKDTKYRFAYELGLGAHWDGPVVIPHAKLGLSWGKGISIADKTGWMNVDASLQTALAGPSNNIFKLDSTVGLNLSKRFSGMVQLFVRHSDHLSATLSASVIYAPKHGKYRLQFAAEKPLGSSQGDALKIGIWRDF